ncbi:splicing factor, suppressor of white-apricot homolog isoform X2 [Bombina bombina]|uniref:splicing factor, suppressor of white-apricot homolog isoform X2 n=1 Tax=Bombina bombina TaxID=8345 RepID=UPI00235B0569|nr:splicing factor, suppressor of white-apricot homolog isoform X2 [Bombina bombina]
MWTSSKKREKFQRLVLADRYDGRGHLHDLSEYDAEHNSWNRNYNLSEEEARIEALCDEERYLALHTDLLEEEARQEEEYKRLSEALAEDGTYNTMGFRYKSDYYDPSQPTEEDDAQKDKDSSDPEDNEEPFIAPEGLNVPSDVELPPTAKMHAIIERTANFVCKQGAQFEIMLKAKQARNSQFDFLRFDHYLNPYYKHIQKAMKEGKYLPQSEKQNQEKKRTFANTGDYEDEDEDDDDEGGDYLHPSLFASKRCNSLEEITKPLKVIDPDHPLAALVRKAQDEKLASQQTESLVAPATQTNSSTETTAASNYYNYYMLPDGTYCLSAPPPGMETNNFYSSLTAGNISLDVTATTVPPQTQTSASSSLSSDTNNKLNPESIPPSSLTPVVAIIPPPPDIQPVIDKLAQYVARNGIKFETSVLAKNDTRFEFMQPWHQYNPYYEFKKHFFMQKEGIPSTQAAPTSDTNKCSTEAPNESLLLPNLTGQDVICTGDPDFKVDDAASKPVNDGKFLKASFAPISFAIKVKETDLLPLEKNRVKLDDSEEEEEGEGKDKQQNKASSSSNSSQAHGTSATVVEEKRPQLTAEELEAKQAKQRLEDRLAAAAREKLAQASKESKEKQLQAERKRKAALFLQTLKNPLDTESGRIEETAISPEVNSLTPEYIPDDRIVPVWEYPVTERSPGREFVKEEKEKKKKKKKKRSRSRSHSPKSYEPKSSSRSHSKVKHSLPTAYRTVRRSRSRSRSPRKPSQSSERRREEDRGASSYRSGHSTGNSRKRTHSPHENKKKKHSRSKSKPEAGSHSFSPSKQGANSSFVHSASISPVESRGSSQERFREVSHDKDGHIASEIVSKVQTKITLDLMAKVKAMLATSKNMHTGTS